MNINIFLYIIFIYFEYSTEYSFTKEIECGFPAF